MIDPVKSGGHALHNGVHLLDLAAWWVGAEPTTVYARGSRQTSSALGIPDYLEIIVEFAGGASAICEISRGHRRSVGNHRDVLVVGSEGVATLPWDGDAALLIDEQAWSVLGARVRRPFQAQLEAWLAAVRGGPPQLPPEAAVSAVAMGVAAEESMRTGRPANVGDIAGEGR
jgi:predicted dehydrogenase